MSKEAPALSVKVCEVFDPSIQRCAFVFRVEGVCIGLIFTTQPIQHVSQNTNNPIYFGLSSWLPIKTARVVSGGWVDRADPYACREIAKEFPVVFFGFTLCFDVLAENLGCPGDFLHPTKAFVFG